MRSRLLAAAVVVCFAALAPAATADSRSSSDNWAGYATYGGKFSAVTGAWSEPGVSCFGRSTASSAASFWVGLGGNGPRATKVEQIGTDSDCDPDGKPDYYAWYELWPAQVVILDDFDVEPGDKLSADVSVSGNAVHLRLQDITSGALYVRTLTMRAPDLTSAEWIAEAPAATVHHRDQVVPLTDFGSIEFTDASATSTEGHRGPISDRAWHWQAIDFKSDRGSGRDPVTSFLDSAAAAHGYPSVLSRHGSAFSLTWKKGERAQTKKKPPPGAI